MIVESTEKGPSLWPFALSFHVFIGPVICILLFSFATAWPSLMGGLFGFLGLLLLLVPLVAALFIGVVPFILLATLAVQLLQREVVLGIGLLASASAGAVLGSVWSRVLSLLSGGDPDSALRLTESGAVAAVLCYLACHYYARRIRARRADKPSARR